MARLLTAAQMRAAEGAAISSGAVSGVELMERAGNGVVEAMMKWRPDLAHDPKRAAILCGPGNNGGDGFVIARLLHQRGWGIDVFLYGDTAKLPPDAAENARRWGEMGAVRPLDDLSDGDLETADVLFDALFGTGLSRGLTTAAREAVERLQRHRKGARPTATVAVDVPSGLCADSGRALGDGVVFMADLTVTFHAMKCGHHIGTGPQACGDVRLIDIGLSPGPSQTRLIDRVPGAHLARNDPFANKYTYGHALILSGGVGRGGAARLAARGALRIGAGLVTVGCPPAALIENAARLDAIMLRSIAGPEALTEVLQDQRISALCLGPGFGVGARMREMTAHALASTRPTVLDADALTSFAEDPETLFANLHERCVLTPHEGEFARLFPDILARLRAPAPNGPAYSKIDATREAAARAGCTLLFKGPDTVIADANGETAVNPAHGHPGASWLATAGSGDVLAGFVTGLLARGLAPADAAQSAAWLHVACADAYGPGLIAEDLPEMLRKVFQGLEPGARASNLI
ncbi:MAG: NAD(P)H-hydrate dehydratase [Pseudomonadota bacterium]